MSKRVYRLGRGPWPHQHVGFLVSQAAISPKFQPNKGVLQREMRRPSVFMGSRDLNEVHGILKNIGLVGGRPAPTCL